MSMRRVIGALLSGGAGSKRKRPRTRWCDVEAPRLTPAEKRDGHRMVLMPPGAFLLSAATLRDRTISTDRDDEDLPAALERMDGIVPDALAQADNTFPAQLWVGRDDRGLFVVNHDARHRTLLRMRAGCKQVPVRIFLGGVRPSPLRRDGAVVLIRNEDDSGVAILCRTKGKEELEYVMTVKGGEQVPDTQLPAMVEDTLRTVNLAQRAIIDERKQKRRRRKLRKLLRRAAARQQQQRRRRKGAGFDRLKRAPRAKRPPRKPPTAQDVQQMLEFDPFSTTTAPARQGGR